MASELKVDKIQNTLGTKTLVDSTTGIFTATEIRADDGTSALTIEDATGKVTLSNNLLINAIKTADGVDIINVTDSATGAFTGTIFPSGTIMLFQQTNSPVGWTKDTTHNNKALRIVNGTCTTGGSQSFTSCFSSRGVSGSVSVSTSNTALNSTSLMPSHNHAMNRKEGGGGSGGGNHYYLGGGGQNPVSYVQSTGGNGSHNHGASGSFSGNNLDMSVQYVDSIFAIKD